MSKFEVSNSKNQKRWCNNLLSRRFRIYSIHSKLDKNSSKLTLWTTAAVEVGVAPKSIISKTLPSAVLIDSESLLQCTLSRPGSTTSMGSRHESELMEQLRKVEESAAKDKWRNIVHFCKEVSTYLIIFNCKCIDKSMYLFWSE